MRKTRSDRSMFETLDDTQRSNLHAAAKTRAQQGLRIPSSPKTNRPPHKPGNQGGTYNGRGAGSTMADTGGGAALMSRVVHARANVRAPKPMRRSETASSSAWRFGRRATSKAVRWPIKQH